MQLELSEEDRAFREEMRDFFTTKVPEEIRDAVKDGQELSKEQIVASQQALNAAGLAVLDVLEGMDLPARAAHIFEQLLPRLEALPHVACVRGRGLLVGVGWLNRADGLLLVLLAVGLGAALLATRRWDGRATWFAAGLGVVVPHALLQAYDLAASYSAANSIPPLPAVAAVVVIAIAYSRPSSPTTSSSTTTRTSAPGSTVPAERSRSGRDASRCARGDRALITPASSVWP